MSEERILKFQKQREEYMRKQAEKAASQPEEWTLARLFSKPVLVILPDCVPLKGEIITWIESPDKRSLEAFLLQEPDRDSPIYIRMDKVILIQRAE